MRSGKDCQLVKSQIEAAVATKAEYYGKGAGYSVKYLCSSFAAGEFAEVDLQDVAQAIDSNTVAGDFEQDFDAPNSCLTLNVSILVNKKKKQVCDMAPSGYVDI